MPQQEQSTSSRDSLKAERVQRSDAATDAARLKAERVQFRAYLETPPGWCLETAQRLTRTFKYADPVASLEATQILRKLSRQWASPPKVRRSEERVEVTLAAPPGESLRNLDLLRAAMIEECCGPDD
jgi:pterin-4a-carbinolamine dehydratase